MNAIKTFLLNADAIYKSAVAYLKNTLNCINFRFHTNCIPYDSRILNIFKQEKYKQQNDSNTDMGRFLNLQRRHACMQDSRW